MGAKDLFSEPFSNETITKLEIFESYCEAWLPTFIMQNERNLFIYDFFSGMGYDKNMCPGSPIRILQMILKFQGLILKRGTKINLLFNEYKKKKFQALQKHVADFITENKTMKAYLNVEFHNEKFEELYPKKVNDLSVGPNLIFIDQNGIKQFSDSIFKEFLSFERTDFLVFISSSYFKRFAHREEFSRHVNIDTKKIQNSKYEFIHRTVLEHYKSMIPSKNTTKLYPFSIRKEKNIYGLIFGAKHIAAVDKFLKIAWKQNNTNGSANFDIDNDEVKESAQLSFFPAAKRKTKIEKFEEDLAEYILNSPTTRTNLDVYLYTLQQAFTSEHSAPVVRRLKLENKITYKGQPKVSYDSYKKNTLVSYIKKS